MEEGYGREESGGGYGSNIDSMTRFLALSLKFMHIYAQFKVCILLVESMFQAVNIVRMNGDESISTSFHG